MKIKDIMTKDARCCSPTTNLAAAAALMLDGDCGMLPIVDEGKLVGIVTDRDLYIALDEYAFGLKGKVAPDFRITPAMRDDFLQRVTARGVTVERSEWEAGRGYIDRLLEDRIARRALGDSTWKRRDVPNDPQLVKALELLRKGRTTAELIALATPPAAAPARRD